MQSAFVSCILTEGILNSGHIKLLAVFQEYPAFDYVSVSSD